jgi:DNA/RNA endonuclease YhcR with UshA esterase domain
VCRARSIVMLVLLSNLAVACGQTVATPSSGEDTHNYAPTYTLYPTYTPYPTYTAPPSPSADIESVVWPNGPRDDVIAWTDAGDFVGIEMVVEGTVARTYNSGKAVFLNFVEDYAGTFTIVIFSEDWSKFPRPPEQLFYGRRIRVQGVIEEYQGTPQIVVRDPWQTEVALTLGQEETCNCEAPTVIEVVATAGPEVLTTDIPAKPTPDMVEPPAKVQVVTWQDAATFAGQAAAVEGRVVAAYNSGKVVFLNFDQDYSHSFKVVIFPDAWPLFPEPPEDMYQGQLVRVTGQVQIYEGAPEIIVETPDAIEILE